MNAYWDYFLPVLALGSAIGIGGGLIGFRRSSRRIIAGAALAAVAAAALWHGPLGGADRFAASVEANVARTLSYYEMTQVHAGLHHGPLTRRVVLQGTADDFQRSELARLMADIPGVTAASGPYSGG